jgi:hypothetical protein
MPWAFSVIEGVERIADYGARAKRYARDHQPEGRRWGWTEDPDFKLDRVDTLLSPRACATARLHRIMRVHRAAPCAFP